MKKVLIVYYSHTGHTEDMARYIAEGVRISGQEAVVKKVSDIAKPEELNGYDGYIFGSPTQFRDIAGPMKAFLVMARGADLKGKPGGAFGSYVHDGGAPAMIFETMQFIFNMELFELGPLNMLETMLEEPGRETPGKAQYVAGEVHGQPGEGMHACQDYGKVFAERLGA